MKIPRNKLDIEVNVDTDEAEAKIERLKRAAEGCAKSLEELGNAIANVGRLIQVPDGKEIAESLEKELAQLARMKGIHD